MNGGLQAGKAVTVPAAAIGAIHRAVSRDREPDEAIELLRQIGLEAGAAYHELFQQWVADSGASESMPEDLESEAFWAQLSEFFQQNGLGAVSEQQLHPGVIELVSGSWAESNNASSGHPGCQISTGLLAELFRRIADRDLAVLEVACRGSGDDECRFLIGSAVAVTQVYDRVQSGDSSAEAVAALPAG